MQTSLRRMGPALAALTLFHATHVRAADGDGVGLGPVIAFSWPNGTYLGWELSAVRGSSILAHLSLGGGYRLAPLSEGLDSNAPAQPTYYHYLAWEPWLYVGATLGAVLTDQFAPRVVYGLWEGLPLSIDGRLFSDDRLQWVFSIALGWRGMARIQQFYIAPKIWRMRGVDFD